MSCDLSHPAILDSYKKLLACENGINWLMVGYQKDSRDVMELIKVGSGNADEVGNYLGDEVQFVFLRLDGKGILVHYIPSSVTGVRRARALVHGRQVATLFNDFDFTVTITNRKDMTEDSLVARTSGTSNSQSSDNGKKQSFSTESATQGMVSPKIELNQRSNSFGNEMTNSVEYHSSSTNALLKEMDKFTSSTNGELTDIKNPSDSKATVPTLVKRASVNYSSYEQDASAQRSRSPSIKSSAGSPSQYASVEIARQRGFSFNSGSAKEVQKHGASHTDKGGLSLSAGLSGSKSSLYSTSKVQQSSQLASQASNAYGNAYQTYVSYQPCNALLWKRKYIVLKDKAIYIYKDESFASPTETLKLQNAKLSNAEEEIALPYSFKVELGDRSSYYFYTEGAPALQQTLEAFQQAIVS